MKKDVMRKVPKFAQPGSLSKRVSSKLAPKISDFIAKATLDDLNASSFDQLIETYAQVVRIDIAREQIDAQKTSEQILKAQSAYEARLRMEVKSVTDMIL